MQNVIAEMVKPLNVLVSFYYIYNFNKFSFPE